MLTITFLGVGGAFAKRNYQSNALIEAWTQSPNAQVEPDDNLLIDFGSTGPLALHDLKDVDGFEYLNDDGHVGSHRSSASSSRTSMRTTLAGLRSWRSRTASCTHR
ncbi:MAG: hypothetical protein R3E58_02630 [Phycisphaerae bacterium]